ncbi:MAG: NADH-quinone oxidoreductase subunit J [Phycisphaeraceae bacterium]
MSYLFFLTAALGAMGLYLVLPHPRSSPRLGAVLAISALAGSLLIWLMPDPQAYPSPYYYIFSVISAAAGVRVITHPRPVYCALYFVIVVLSSAGMLVLLDAEFMAFAMILIYGGAILVTYMFVIMLATLPQSSHEPDSAPDYDRTAREPMLSVVMGMALIAALASAMFTQPSDAISPRFQTTVTESAADMPGKISLPKLEAILRAQDVIESNETVAYEEDFDLEAGTVGIRRIATDGTISGARVRHVALNDEILGEFIYNIDHVGLALFKGHTLGIELAGVILLLAMVGAIVIARRKVPEPEPETGPS